MLKAKIKLITWAIVWETAFLNIDLKNEYFVDI